VEVVCHQKPLPLACVKKNTTVDLAWRTAQSNGSEKTIACLLRAKFTILEKKRRFYLTVLTLYKYKTVKLIGHMDACHLV
jgi:hypothetical protein